MTNLKELENKSIYIIREVKSRFKNPAVMCSFGKDSTVLLYLIKRAFNGEIPFKVIHIDTTFKFPEIYKFRDKLVKNWNIDLIIAKKWKLYDKRLFNLESDPLEEKDVSEEYPSIKEYLENKLNEILQNQKSAPEEKVEIDKEALEQLRSLRYMN